MEKYSCDHLILPEQVDELNPICFDPVDEGNLCFRIHINGRFFMILADDERQAKDYLGFQLKTYFPQLLGPYFWTIEEVKKPRVFVQVTRIDFVDCVNWTEKNNEIAFAGLVDIQKFSSLHEFCLSNIGVESNRGIKLSSDILFQGDETTAHSFVAYFFDAKGDRIKDLYFYEWYVRHV